jgi:hypothetical protein
MDTAVEKSAEWSFAMHDALIAIAFATFVIAPCLVCQTPPDVSDPRTHAN